MNSVGRILAIDFGERRLGVAVSDPSGRIAQPLAVIERTDLKQDLDRLSDIIHDFGASRIVVGNPRTMAGQEGKQAKIVHDFIIELRGVVDVPIESYDERLSSKEARASLEEAGVRGRRAKGVVDKVAAALFLQSYLDRQAGRA